MGSLTRIVKGGGIGGEGDASVKFNQAVPLVIMDEWQALKCKLESGSRTA